MNMKAETAYNVIKSLPVDEVPRLFKMLGVESAPVVPKITTPLLSDEDAVDYLIKHLKLKKPLQQ